MKAALLKRSGRLFIWDCLFPFHTAYGFLCFRVYTVGLHHFLLLFSTDNNEYFPR